MSSPRFGFEMGAFWAKSTIDHQKVDFFRGGFLGLFFLRVTHGRFEKLDARIERKRTR